ncbi:MAG: Chemotaxis response regulator protein-glutamate methylesterase [Pseudomonadota bacterium]
MADKPIRVMIIANGAFMRMAVRKLLEKQDDIEIVGDARNGQAGLEAVTLHHPDVIVLDIDEPLNGVMDQSDLIIKGSYCPVLILSGLMDGGAEATLMALEMGAVDFVSKKSAFVQLDIVQIGERLLEKVRYWARHGNRMVVRSSVARNTETSRPSEAVSRSRLQKKVDLIVVGVSTGGPAMMPKFLMRMGRLACPVVIAQHMPAVFTRRFAEHMRNETGLNVLEGSNGMVLEAGMVVIAPGDTDSVVRESASGKLMLYQHFNHAENIHPSADELFLSASKLSVGVVGVIMTGMGNDGTRGAQMLYQQKMPVLVQSPESCVVDGMPRSAIAAGVVADVLSVEDIGKRLARWCA